MPAEELNRFHRSPRLSFEYCVTAAIVALSNLVNIAAIIRARQQRNIAPIPNAAAHAMGADPKN
jgi:hypothetical protein